MAVIGMMDSGVGGLSVLREVYKALPGEHYVYYADNANCPYGEKSPEFILERCREITRMMLDRGAQAMVIACNTATAAAIAELRAEFDIPFIGMEPAVKPAALGTRSGVIGVLATAGTLKASKYLKTRGRFEDDVKIVEHVGSGFVELVEAGDTASDHAREVVGRSLQPLLDAGADNIVLGCTHYPFLQGLISGIAGPGVRVIDPAPAVARRLLDVLRERGISETDPRPGVELLASGSDKVLNSIWEFVLKSLTL